MSGEKKAVGFDPMAFGHAVSLRRAADLIHARDQGNPAAEFLLAFSIEIFLKSAGMTSLQPPLEAWSLSPDGASRAFIPSHDAKIAAPSASSRKPSALRLEADGVLRDLGVCEDPARRGIDDPLSALTELDAAFMRRRYAYEFASLTFPRTTATAFADVLAAKLSHLRIRIEPA